MLPLFFVVIFTDLFVVSILFLHKDMYSVVESAISSVFFIVSIYFARSSAGYFATATE